MRPKILAGLRLHQFRGNAHAIGRANTEPSTNASTPNSCAICAGLSCLSLYCITDVREMTRSFLICESSVISASDIPSAK